MFRRIARTLWMGVFATTVLFAQSNSQKSATAPASDPEVEKRVDSILSRMTLEQKIELLGGIKSFYIRGYKELGLPEQKMSDGPVGNMLAAVLSIPALAWAGVNHDALLAKAGLHCPFGCGDHCPLAK